MKNRFRIYEVCNGFMLEDLVTGRLAACGDGVDQFEDLRPGESGFVEQWTKEVNEEPDIFEAYFYDLYKLVIFDNPKFIDRYTVITGPASSLEKSLAACENLCNCLGLSINPDSPQGFSQWGTCNFDHMDKTQEQVRFLGLPDNVQRHLAQRLEDE